VIDAVDLVLGKTLVQRFVQLPRRFEVPAKGLFDNDAPPQTIGLFRQPGLAELGGDHAKEARRCCQVEQVIARCALFPVNLAQ